MANKFLLKNPILTEKAVQLTAENKYVFLVEKKANVAEIKKAVKEAYKVDAIGVNMIVVKPKTRRLGRSVGTKPGYKKAIVTLKKGQKIDLAGV